MGSRTCKLRGRLKSRKGLVACISHNAPALVHTSSLAMNLSIKAQLLITKIVFNDVNITCSTNQRKKAFSNLKQRKNRKGNIYIYLGRASRLRHNLFPFL